MADTVLSPTGLVQIEVGASEDTWGDKLNANFGIINNLLSEPDGLVLLGSASPSGVGAVAFTSIPAGHRRLMLVLRGVSGTLESTYLVDYSINNGSSWVSYFGSGQVGNGIFLTGCIELINYAQALVDTNDAPVAGPVFGTCILSQTDGTELSTRSPAVLPGAPINALRVRCLVGNFDAGSVDLIAE